LPESPAVSSARGADILATNSFNANRISQADYGAEHLVGDINRAAARIIREVIDEATAADGKQRWVVGAVGPTNKTLSAVSRRQRSRLSRSRFRRR
jgi:5-methyltetrahydrofolate--homocysteine methyltransferase